MKKYFYVISTAIVCLCSNSALCQIEETFTYGTPPSSSWGGMPAGVDTGAMTKSMIWEMQHAQSVQSGRSVYEQIKACQKYADDVGVKCKGAYNDLESMCQGMNVIAGGGAAAVGKLFFAKIGVTVSKEVSGAISGGAATAGFTIDDAIIPCSTLTARAMSFCEAGVQKLKSTNCR